MKLKLSDVIDTLEQSDVENRSYYNKKTGEILWSMDNNPEYSTYKEDDEFDDDIIYMFGFNSINEYELMEDFIGILKNVRISNELWNAIQGRGAFRRFKDVLYEYDLENKWYKYRDSKYKEVAIEWCKENNIDFE